MSEVLLVVVVSILNVEPQITLSGVVFILRIHHEKERSRRRAVGASSRLHAGRVSDPQQGTTTDRLHTVHQTYLQYSSPEYYSFCRM